MAKPSRRAYSLLDSYGQDYNLARMLSGAKTSELRAFFEPIEPELTDQNEYLEAIYRSNHERITEKTAAMKARHEAKQGRIYDWTEKRTDQAQSLEAKEQYGANYPETAKTLAEEEAQALAKWKAKTPEEKIRQLEEEWIRREMEQKREQGRGRSRGLSL